MASSNYNTTNLSLGASRFDSSAEESSIRSGTIGTRNFADYTSRKISANVSKRNYETMIVSDQRLQKFRDAVYKMVSGWLPEDCLAILTEYGDSSSLSKNYTSKELYKATTESIIVHLNPKDLNTLYNDVIISEHEMMSDIKAVNKEKKKAAKKYFSISTFDDVFARLSGSKNNKSYRKALDAYDDSFKVQKDVVKGYPVLRKELDDVLKTCFNIIEVTGLAFSMGIEIQDGTPDKEVRRWIINKTILYVDLISGHGNKAYSNMFIDVEPYNKLLKMTSYSYITGEPGLNPGDWVMLKKQARAAKKAMQESAHTQNNRSDIFYGKTMKALTGGKTAYTRGGLTRKLTLHGDSGVLANATYDQLVELAGKYGIDPNAFRNMNENVLKAKIYNGMRAETERIGRLNIANRALSKLKLGTTVGARNLQDRLAAHTSYTNSNILKPLSLDTVSDAGSAVPTIRINGAGKRISESLLTAVPVYIVGQENKNISGSGKLGNIGALVTSKSSTKGLKSVANKMNGSTALSDEDGRILAYIQNLPSYSSSKEFNATGSDQEARKGLPRSINEVLNILSSSGYSKQLQLAYHTYPDKDSREYKTAIAYIYAMAINHTNLAKYISETTGIYFKAKTSKRKAAKINSLIKGSLSAKINNIKAHFGKNIKSYSELPDKSKLAYDYLNNLNYIELEALVKRDGYDNFAFIDFIKKYHASSDFSNALKALHANHIGDISLRNLFENSINDIALLTDTKKIYKHGILQRARKILNFFSRASGNKNNMLAAEGIASEEKPLQSLIGWSNGHISGGNEAINAVTPVYVVNLLEKAPDAMSSVISAPSKGEFNSIGAAMLLSSSSALEDSAASTKKKSIKKLLTPEAANMGQYMSDEAYHKLSRRVVRTQATPVFMVNDMVKSYDLSKQLTSIDYTLLKGFSELELGLSAETVSAPGGVGIVTRPNLVASGINNTKDQIIADLIDTAAKDRLEKIITANTGGIISPIKKLSTGGKVSSGTTASFNRFASGGTASVITGDSAGSNIFSGGAKPELVQSNGSISVTPLNSASTATSEKTSTLSSTDRNKALAVSAASHVIKYSYTLPNGAEDVSNVGEAIKTFSVKPGIMDDVDVAGQTTSLMLMLANIYAQLVSIGNSETTGNSLLTAIAATASSSNSNTAPSTVNNPFAGTFSNTMDTILEGD